MSCDNGRKIEINKVHGKLRLVFPYDVFDDFCLSR